LWRHPRVVWRRILAAWPFVLWIIAIGVVMVLYAGSGQLQGMTGIVDTTSEPIAAIETARLKAIHVTLGQRIAPGDVLVEMDTSLVDASIAQVEAEKLQAESSQTDFERRTLSTVQNFEDAIKSAQFAIQDWKRRMVRDQAELTALETEQARRDDLLEKGWMDATVAHELRPQIAQLRGEIEAYPALVTVEEERLESARRGREDLINSLQLEEGENVRDAIRRRAVSDRAVFEAMRLTAEIQRKGYTLRATRGGVVSRIFHHPGHVVPAGEPILRIVSTKPDFVIGFLPESHLQRVKEKQQVIITRRTAANNRVPGRVVSIAPEVDTLPMPSAVLANQRLRGRRVIVRLEGKHDLIPGETVRVEGTRPSFMSRLRGLFPGS